MKEKGVNMAKSIIIILLLASLAGGCTTTKGRQAGALIEIMGAISSVALGFDPISGAALAVTGGSVLISGAVEETIDGPE